MIQACLEVALEFEIAPNIGKRSLIGAILARRRREKFWVWAAKGLIPYPPGGVGGVSELSGLRLYSQN